MSIRLPLRTALTQSYANETGTSSAAGGIAIPFTMPQDADNAVVKLTASTVGGGVSAVFQTTDDGGTTWYDVARTSIVSNADNNTAVWANVGVNGTGMATAQNGFPTASILTVGVRSTAASTLAANQVSGLPILSQQARIFLILTGNHTAATGSAITVQVKVNSQSATA